MHRVLILCYYFMLKQYFSKLCYLEKDYFLKLTFITYCYLHIILMLFYNAAILREKILF